MEMFQGPRDWGRLLTAMVTPFDSRGGVDYDEAARIAKFLVTEQGNDGLVVNGTTGESPTLSHTEKFELLRVILDAVGDKAAVVFGAGSYNTAESIENTREAEKLGAHGIMLVNPYYNRPGQAGLEAHFTACAKATGLPVLLYNIAPRSAINLETDTLLKLAELPNVVGVKEASGMIGQISEVCRRAPKGFRVYSGDDGLTLPMLALGAHGLVSVVAHVVGRELKEMIENFETHPEKSRRIHHSLAPIFSKMFAFPSPTPIKYALSKFGYGTEDVRLPLVTLATAEKSVIDEVIAPYRKHAGATK